MRSGKIMSAVACCLGALLLGSMLVWAQEPVRIKVMLRGDSPQREAFAKEIIPAYEAAHPGIKAEWEPTASGWQQRMVVSYAAGVAPDVTEMFSTFSQEWAEAGMLLDLRPYVQRDLSAADIRDFFPQIWNAGVLFHGPRKGIMYGVPRYVNLIGSVAYNVNKLEAAGLVPIETLDAQGRWNWESFREYLIKLTQRTDDGRTVQWGLCAPPASRWMNILLAGGGRLFNYPDDPYEFILNRPESIYALEYWQTLYALDKVIANAWWTTFERGEAAIDMSGSEVYGSWSSEVIGDRFEWNLGPLPMGPAGRGASSAKDQYGIIATTKHPDEAWAFVKFCISPEGQRIMMRSSGVMPMRSSLLREFVRMFPGKNVQYMADVAPQAFIDQKAVAVEAKRVISLIDSAVNISVIQNLKPVRQAIEEIVPQIEAIMKEAPR
ncbi:MAG: sugar ABC transporter substrate-binding protein [Firmicutes bacterium]|jgi:multiple sugar transport system substrate-binding protein|nr:sugar ABC transporter substrate-binding protein [Bacillota bacterium]